MAALLFHFVFFLFLLAFFLVSAVRIVHFILALLYLELHVEESLDVAEHRDRLLSNSTDLDCADIVAGADTHQQKRQALIRRIDAATCEDFVEHAEASSFAKVFWQREFLLRSEVEVFGQNNTCRCFSSERNGIPWLVSALAFLVMVRVDPDVWNVIIEDLP